MMAGYSVIDGESLQFVPPFRLFMMATLIFVVILFIISHIRLFMMSTLLLMVNLFIYFAHQVIQWWVLCYLWLFSSFISHIRLFMMATLFLMVILSFNLIISHRLFMMATLLFIVGNGSWNGMDPWAPRISQSLVSY